MVVRMTGAGWLAAMMRAEREEPEDRPAWLLDAASTPEAAAALELLAAAETP